VLRKIAKEYKTLPLGEVQKLLKSKIHEHRLVALYILIFQFNAGDDMVKKQIYTIYCAHTRCINNWDLVDTSAPYIVGAYLSDRPRRDLYTFARSKSLWEQRIAIVATLYFIRKGDVADAIKIAEMLLTHPHPLIHKAVGWMLREVGKRDVGVLRKFLDTHYRTMSRTTLRYAIEKFPEEFRQYFLKRV
jgi:3-methyladenine DNA glycosylase AlkD